MSVLSKCQGLRLSVPSSWLNDYGTRDLALSLSEVNNQKPNLLMIPKQRKQLQQQPKLEQQVAAIVHRSLKSAIETKNHFVNSGTATQNFTSAGTLLLLSGISEGTSDSTRIGDSIRLQHLTLRLRLVVGTSPDVFRLIVWRYKPLHTSVSVDTPVQDVSGLDYQTCMSPISPKRKQDVVILKDYFSTLTSTSNNIAGLHFEIPLNNAESMFAGSGYTNAIYISLFGEGTPANTYVYSSHLVFTDA